MVQEAAAELFAFIARVDDELRHAAFVEQGWTAAEYGAWLSKNESEQWAGITRDAVSKLRSVAEVVPSFMCRN